MEANEISRLVLFIAISISILGISIQIMRLLGALTNNINDLRKSVKNLGIIMEEFAQDQKLIRSGIENLVSASKKIQNVVDLVTKKIAQPLALISGFLTSISSVVKKIKRD